MKNVLIFTLLLFGTLTIFAAEEKETEKAPAENQETTQQVIVQPNMKDFSYTLGYEMFTNNKKYKLVLSSEKLLEGINDGYANAELKVKQDEMKAQHAAFMAHVQTGEESDFTDNGTLSYVTGYQVGKNFSANGIDAPDFVRIQFQAIPVDKFP